MDTGFYGYDRKRAAQPDGTTKMRDFFSNAVLEPGLELAQK